MAQKIRGRSKLVNMTTQLEKDMVRCMRDLLGSGYIDEYYRQMASEFIQVAQRYLDDALGADKRVEVPTQEKFPTMNIHSLRGTKVTPIYQGGKPKNGYAGDRDVVAKYLKEGGVYTVDRTQVHSSSTNVWLIEVPGVCFNSVSFSEANHSVFDDKEIDRLAMLRFPLKTIIDPDRPEHPFDVNFRERMAFKQGLRHGQINKS